MEKKLPRRPRKIASISISICKDKSISKEIHGATSPEIVALLIQELKVELELLEDGIY